MRQTKVSIKRASLRFVAGASGFELAAPGFSLSSAPPPSSLLLGVEERAVSLRPEGRPTFRRFVEKAFAGSREGLELRWSLGRSFSFVWRVSLHSSLPLLFVGGRIENESPEEAALLEGGLLSSGGAESLRCDGAAKDWLLSTVGELPRAGLLSERLPSANEQTIEVWRGFKMPVPFELPSDEFHADGSWRCFKDFMTLYSSSGSKGLAIAAAGEPRSFVDLRCKTDGSSLRLEASAELNGVLLRPGEGRELQEIAVLAMPYQEAMELAMRMLASTHGARVSRKPVSGWCSWYSRGPKVSAEDVASLCSAATELRDRAPMDFIQIDDGFQRTVGDWSCNERFPEGWAALLKGIEAAGAKPGVWLAPLAVHESCEAGKAHPDWLQRKADGSLAGEAGNWGPTSHWLDPSHPGAQGFIRSVLRGFVEAGFDYFKIDFNNLCEGARFHDRSLTRLQIYRKLYELYREELGEGRYLLSCSGFSRGTIGYADGSRISPDSCAKWSASHPCCIAECLKTVGATSFSNGILYANDPDVTYLGPEGSLSEDEWRSWHSYVGVLGGFAMFSSEIWRKPSSERIASYEILLPPAPEKGRSIDGGTDVLHKALGFLSKRPWGDSATLTAYNPSSQARDLSADLSLLGLDHDAESLLVWSFWNEESWVAESRSLVVRRVPSHGCALLRVSKLPGDGRPCFAGSTLHVSCGAAELSGFRYVGGELFVELSDAGARSGALFISYGGALKLKSCGGLSAAAPSRNASGLWRVAVEARSGAAQTLVFECR